MSLDSLRFLEIPDLRTPALVTAFAGWSDAGAAASTSAQYLIDRWHAAPLAEIEAEEFYDFTQQRPMVRYVEGDYRRIEWPENVFHYHRTPERDLIVFAGIEPHLHWKAYVNLLLEIVRRFKVELVVNLGAFFVDFPHTRPLRVSGTAPDPEMLARAGVFTTGGRYEGPTGLNGVFSTTLREQGIPLAALWANVPHYVSAMPNPAACLALLRALTAMLSVDVPLGRMIRSATAFQNQLNEATSKNDEVSDYVRTLEERVDSEASGQAAPTELPATDKIVQEIEEFFRRPRDEST